MAMVSFAVVVWFGRRGVPEGANVFKVFIAPGIAFLALAGTVVFALSQFDALVGGTSPTDNLWLVLLLLSGMVIGVALAVYFKDRKPEIFRNLGREQRVLDLAPES